MKLPDVTLCAADTLHPDLAMAALRRCMAVIDFPRVLLFTDARRLTAPADGVDVIDVRIAGREAYSRFILCGITEHLQTSHLLIVQWDGWIRDAQCWHDDFLSFDYIGATWPADRTEGGRLPAVGNGGFSLRSLRLLKALGSPGMVLEHPEDKAICWHNRERLQAEFGIRFAPPAVAEAFSCERPWSVAPTFGFHGVFNFHCALPRDELRAVLTNLPDDLGRHNETRKLIVELLNRNWLDEAALLIAARRRHGMRDLRTLRLRGRLALARAQRRLGGAAERPAQDPSAA